MAENSLSPIFIASPVKRSGTTLVQRLLCSSDNALIYGESCANDLILISTLLSSKQINLGSAIGFRNGQLHAVLHGEVNSWIPDLMPEIEEYLNVYEKSLISIMEYYAHFAQRHNRSIWGMKLPEWNPANLVQLHEMFPKSKVIFIHRNLEDCVKSAKRMDMIRGNDELHRFCQIWKQFTDFANENLRGSWVLHLQYRDLVGSVEESVHHLEVFTGAKAIDAEVINFKINTYGDDVQLLNNPTPYLEPSPLSEDEKNIIAAYWGA